MLYRATLSSGTSLSACEPGTPQIHRVSLSRQRKGPCQKYSHVQKQRLEAPFSPSQTFLPSQSARLKLKAMPTGCHTHPIVAMCCWSGDASSSPCHSVNTESSRKSSSFLI